MKPLRLSLSEYNGRISPVLDTCQRILLVDIDESGQRTVHNEDWSTLPRWQRPARLRQLGVDILLCGAVSPILAEQIHRAGIRLYPWLAGEVGQLLEAFLAGGEIDPAFTMPGCRGRQCRQRNRARRTEG